MKFIFFIFLSLLGNSAAHEFKMSVCEIIYSEERSEFELKFYLFQDDLKEVIYGNPESPDLDAKAVEKYLSQNVSLHLDGQPQRLILRTIQEKNDQVLVTFALPCPDYIKATKLQVSNQIMVDKFRKQTNMVFLQLPQKDKLTLLLDAKKTEGSFDLK